MGDSLTSEPTGSVGYYGRFTLYS